MGVGAMGSVSKAWGVHKHSPSLILAVAEFGRWIQQSGFGNTVAELMEPTREVRLSAAP